MPSLSNIHLYLAFKIFFFLLLIVACVHRCKNDSFSRSSAFLHESLGSSLSSIAREIPTEVHI